LKNHLESFDTQKNEKSTLQADEREALAILKKKYINVQKELSDVFIGEFAAVNGFLSGAESS